VGGVNPAVRLVNTHGFIRNMALGELAGAFPHANGIPGYPQGIFMKRDGVAYRYERGELIGGFCGCLSFRLP
jgi:hypothetical protein